MSKGHKSKRMHCKDSDDGLFLIMPPLNNIIVSEKAMPVTSSRYLNNLASMYTPAGYFALPNILPERVH